MSDVPQNSVAASLMTVSVYAHRIRSIHVCAYMVDLVVSLAYRFFCICMRCCAYRAVQTYIKGSAFDRSFRTVSQAPLTAIEHARSVDDTLAHGKHPLSWWGDHASVYEVVHGRQDRQRLNKRLVVVWMSIIVHITDRLSVDAQYMHACSASTSCVVVWPD